MMKYIVTGLILLMFSVNLYAQTKISGTVKDENGQPLIGATVVVKNTTNGVTTNAKGEFALNNVKKTDVIQVTFVGYLPKDITVGNQTTAVINMAPDAFKIDEVVAIGYGTANRRDLTGAVSSVSASDIAGTATANYDQALAGRVAGVQVSAVDGTPGQGLNIVIRGGNSITGDNSPLYVVDGIPLDNFDPSSLSSNDIANLDILKDASSTAIYGARGANGVILITTKTGRADGKTDISAGVSYGVSWIPGRLEVMNPYDYVRYQQEIAYALDGYNPGEKMRSFERTWVDPELYRNAKGTSWQDEIFRNAGFAKANVSMSGGGKNTTIYYSGEYLDQDGTLLNTGFRKIINNLKFTHKIGEFSKISGQLQYSYSKTNGQSISGNSYNSIIRDAVQYRPIEPINGDGFEEGGYDPEDMSYKYLFNPIKSLKNTDRISRSDVIRGTISFERTLAKNLKLMLSGNYQTDTRRTSVFFGQDTQQGTTGVDKINGSITNYRYQNLSTSNTLNYTLKKQSHNLNVLVGFEASGRSTENSSLKNTQLPTDIFGIDKIELGTAPGIPTSYRGRNTMASFFGRISYTFNDKYLFTFNMRADGSSKFAEDNRWGYFPSFSAAWRINEEKFMKDIDWLSNLKFRGGWGLTGNNRIGDFDAMTLFNFASNSGYTWGPAITYVPGAYLSNLGVPDLRWETTAQTSIGLDMGFLNNRISASVDYYYKKTRDLLLNAEMALSTGFDKVQQNVGKVSNEGLEFTLNTVNIVKKNFQWQTSFNISFNHNKVLQLNKGQSSIYTNPNFLYSMAEYAYITTTGRPVGQIYGLQFDGIYQFDDFNYNASTGTYTLKPGIPDNGAAVAPGSVKYVDRNGDMTIDSEDRKVLGDTSPKHFGGFTNDFTIAKNFDVQVFFQWSYGGKILNANKSILGAASNSRHNALAEVANFWSPQNTNTNINGVRFNTIFGEPKVGNQIDSRHIEDASYLRLKSVSIGYTLPQRVARKILLNKVRVYASAQNLWTWTNYSGYDPDVSVGKYGALTPHLDYSAYPQSATFMFGIDIAL